MTLKKYFASILWEYDINTLDIESDIVCERVLNLGDKKVSDSWLQELGSKKAREKFLQNKHKLDKKSLNYWSKYFNSPPHSINSGMYEKLHSPIFSRNIR